jgi:hypothetical protein
MEASNIISIRLNAQESSDILYLTQVIIYK